MFSRKPFPVIVFVMGPKKPSCVPSIFTDSSLVSYVFADVFGIDVSLPVVLKVCWLYSVSSRVSAEMYFKECNSCWLRLVLAELFTFSILGCNPEHYVARCVSDSLCLAPIMST